jgi:UDP-N-acetylmuramyl pentapeptide synthase
MKSFFVSIIRLILYGQASVFRSRYSGPVIAITGSVGKTSTKEAVGQMIKKAYGNESIVTPKSLNTEIGVPLTILGFQSEPHSIFGWLRALARGTIVAFFGQVPKCMVLELGADHKGDIAYLARLVRPTHAVITSVSESHSQFLGNLEAIQQEKTSLLQFVSLDGWIFLNGNDDYLSKIKVADPQHKILVRLHQRADYFVSGISVNESGTHGVLHHDNRTQRLLINRFGEHHLYSVLFAAAIGDSLNIPANTQLQAFKEIRPMPGRGSLIHGKNSSLILDESYNAQPEAMEAALALLKQFPGQKKIAILGDMRELRDPAPIHKRIGKLAKLSADYVIAVGPESKNYQADTWFMTADEAVPTALRQLQPGAIVLVKGSQNSIRLERLVKALMAHPNQSKQLLVRQEAEWLAKT